MRLPLVEELPEQQRRQFLASCRRRRFARGEVVFHEGDPADSLHLLVSGRARILVTAASGDVVTLTVVGPGATFGDIALLCDPPTRSATVSALEPCETLSISAPQLQRLRAAHPAVDRLLLRLLAGQVRRLTEQLVEALYLPADRRVLRRLLDLASLYGDGAAVPLVPVTQSMLATMAGTSRVTANQVLQRAEATRCVELTRGRVRVLDLAQLQRLAR